MSRQLPGWLALIGALLVAAVVFPIVTGDALRALPPAVLAVAMAALLIRDLRAADESGSADRVRNRRAIAVLLAIAGLTAVAGVVVIVADALS